MKIFGRIICAVKRKHLRGHYVADTDTHKVYRCPRCHRETRYKVRQPLAGNGTSGEEL